MTVETKTKTDATSRVRVADPAAVAAETCRDVLDFNTATWDAMMKSGSIWARGVQSLNKTLIGFARISMDENGKAAQALMACRSVQDVVDLETKVARETYPQIVNRGCVLSSMAIQVAEDSLVPLTNRVKAAMDSVPARFEKALAA